VSRATGGARPLACVTAALDIRLVGSLAGAARLLDHNAGVQRRAQGGRKPPVAHKGKCLPEHAACAACTGNGGLAIPAQACGAG